MTPGHADELGRELYDSHPAAAPLLMAAVHGETPEVRLRSARALQWLDHDTPALSAPVPFGLEGPAHAIAYVVVSGIALCPDRSERMLCAGLLEAVCKVAERLHQQEPGP